MTLFEKTNPIFERMELTQSELQQRIISNISNRTLGENKPNQSQLAGGVKWHNTNNNICVPCAP